MRAGVAGATLVLLLATPASAQNFPARSGELGIIDVPDAEVAGAAHNLLAAELRFDRVAGSRSDFGPLPAYLITGLHDRLDLGLTMREWGQPGDPRPARVLFGTAAKFQLVPPVGGIPGAAVSAVFDRVNDLPVVAARVAMSTGDLPLRLAGFLGVEAGRGAQGKKGVAAGLAAGLPLKQDLHLEAEALISPQGPNLGAALRWNATRTTGISFGANYLPKDDGLRVSLTFAFWPARAQKTDAAAVPQHVAERTEEEQKEARGFTDDRPHFRLRMAWADASRLGQPRRLQFGPFTPPADVAVAAPATTGPRAAVPSIEDLAAKQLAENQALADARGRRIQSTFEQLDAREKAALAERKRLEDREREQQLDGREQRIVRRSPTPQIRQLESLEQQLAAQERQALAQERSFGPAIEAAEGRARDAAARETAERQEADRLAASASVSGAAGRTQQLELRKQALAAKNRQLAASESRLVARGEQIDAVERQLPAFGQRLDAKSRRLDTRSERLDLLENPAAESRPAPVAPKTTEAAPAAPKDKAVFVMVVKTPTAIVKEGKAASAAPAPSSALQPGGAVEKAVAAATVVAFPTPASQLSELDRETVDNIVKLAAKEGCELLIWARAKDPSSMAEAQRRAAEIRERATSVGSLHANQIVTRITTRPGAQGVEIVISALRETAKPAGAAAAPARPAGPALAGGESGKRQIREAVQAAQRSIEACIGERLATTKVQRAEGVLKITVSTIGEVANIATSGGDLAGEQLEGCLTRASASWRFPSADANYAVDVPISVVRGGER